MYNENNRALIANACNLSGLYFLSKGIRIDQLSYSVKVIKEFCKGIKYRTQLQIYENISPDESSDSPILLSNILYSGCTNSISNLRTGKISDISIESLITSAIYFQEGESIEIPKCEEYITTETGYKVLTYVEMLLIDSYINLTRYEDMIDRISVVLNTPKDTLIDIIKTEIELYKKIFLKPIDNNNLTFIHQIDIDSILENKNTNPYISLVYGEGKGNYIRNDVVSKML